MSPESSSFSQEISQENSGKVLGATSYDCCNFKHKMWKGGGRRPPSSSCPRIVEQIVSRGPRAEDSSRWLHNPRTTYLMSAHIFVLSLPCLTIWLFLLLHIPHFYWSKCIYFITFNPAYSKFLSTSTLKVFLVLLSYHWFFFFPSCTVWLSQDYSFRGQRLWLAPKPMIWADSSQGSPDSAGMFSSPRDPHFFKWFWNRKI